MPALAGPGDARADFERQLKAWSYHEASASLDAIIDARLPKDGVPRADPELNGLIGRFLLVRGEAGTALAYLQAAHMPGRSAEDESVLLVAEGQAQLIRGDPARAFPLFDQALARPASATVRAAASRARIEALLVLDPAQAEAAIAGASADRAADAAHDWEWSLFEAQAALLTGRSTEAKKAATHAWNGATAVSLTGAAGPARVAAMLGVLAARDGDQGRALALLASAAHGAGNSGDIASKIVERLPVCGGPVGRDDVVTIAVFRDDEARVTRVTPLAASRPQIVPAFLDGLDGGDLADNDTVANAAVVVEVRCRTAPPRRAPAKHPAPDPASRWAASRGILPRFNTMGDPPEQMTTAAQLVDRLTDRYGADSPLLVGPLLRLSEMTKTRLMTQGDVAPGRVTDLDARVLALLRKQGGTEAFLPLDASPIGLLAKIAAATSPDQARSIMSSSYQAFLARTDFDTAYATYRSTNDEVLLTAAQRALVVESLLTRGRASVGANDPRVMSLIINQILAARGDEDFATMKRLIRESKLQPDICELREVGPRVTGNAITSDDFPTQGIIADLTGKTTLEFDLDATGKHASPRLLASIPPFLFEDALRKRQATITFDPAQSGGKPVACRGFVQSVQWQFPEDSDRDGFGPAMPWRTGT